MVRPARIGAFTFGIQVIWGAILGVSLQSRTDAFAGANAVTVFSYVLAAGAAIATVTQVLAGVLADARSARVGHRREFYLWGVAAAIPALVWFYVAQNLLQLALAFFALQLALNFATGPYQAAIPDYVPPQRQGEASSWMSAWQSLGNVVGLLVVTFVADLRAVAAAFVAVLLGSFAVTYRHVRSLAARPVAASRFAIDHTFVMLLVSRGTINLGFFTLLAYLLFYVKQSLRVVGADAVRTDTGLLFITFTVAAVAGAALAARPSDRYDTRAVATVANAVVVLALAVLAPAPNLPIAFGAAGLAGAAWGAFFSADWALACALLPRGSMATAMGVWNVATAGPQVLAPLIALPIVNHFNGVAAGLGPRAAIVLALVEFAIGTALLWRLPPTRSAAAAVGPA